MTAEDEIKETEHPIVYVIDDDKSIRDSLEDLLASVGLSAKTYASAPEFMRSERPDRPACIVLDVRMPDLSGLDFQEEAIRQGIHIPIVFITAHGDIPMSVRAMKSGAIEFLTKPFREQDLLEAIQHGILQDSARRRDEQVVKELRRRYAGLSEGEREVLDLVVQGLLNKQIAARLDISEVTVKTRRSRVMQKMQAQSLAELVRYCERLHEGGKGGLHG